MLKVDIFASANLIWRVDLGDKIVCLISLKVKLMENIIMKYLFNSENGRGAKKYDIFFLSILSNDFKCTE